MIKQKTITLLLPVLSAALLIGCAQQQQRRSSTKYTPPPAAAPRKAEQAPVPKPAPAPAPRAAETPAAVPVSAAVAPIKTSCGDPTWGLVKMDKIMPGEASIGGEVLAELQLTAQACAGNVVVRDTLPANASYVRSEPAAVVEGKQLTWSVGNLDGGETRTLKLWLKPEAEGTIVNCATVSADPRTCASTKIVRPAIQLTKVAPAEVTTCDPIPVVLTVRNNGSSPLTGVRVTDTLPEGLVSDGKRDLSFDVGNLEPNQTREIKFNATTVRPGKYVNVAKVTAAQGVSADATATTIVREPVLTITCTAPEQRYMGRPFDVCFTVVNKGDATSGGTVLQVPMTTGLSLKSSTASGRTSDGNLVWDLGTLAPGASKEVCATLVSAGGGTFRFNGTVKGACAKPVSTTCQTTVVGISALLLETLDDPDPIAIAEQTTYTVRVTNQGTADDTNIKMVVEFPAEVTPVSASNNGVVDGKKVTFGPYPRLAPKAVFTYTIKAKGEKVGDARIRFIRTSDGIPAPTTSEESTRVY